MKNLPALPAHDSGRTLARFSTDGAWIVASGTATANASAVLCLPAGRVCSLAEAMEEEGEEEAVASLLRSSVPVQYVRGGAVTALDVWVRTLPCLAWPRSKVTSLTHTSRRMTTSLWEREITRQLCTPSRRATC
jgi:hypothetical protein